MATEPAPHTTGPAAVARPPARVAVTWAGHHAFDAGRPGGPTVRLDAGARTGPSPVDALLSALAVARHRFRVASRRTVTPARVPRGRDAEVRLELSNAGHGTGGLWLLSESLPPELMSFCTRKAMSNVMTRGTRKNGM